MSDRPMSPALVVGDDGRVLQSGMEVSNTMIRLTIEGRHFYPFDLFGVVVFRSLSSELEAEIENKSGRFWIGPSPEGGE